MAISIKRVIVKDIKRCSTCKRELRKKEKVVRIVVYKDKRIKTKYDCNKCIKNNSSLIQARIRGI